MSIPNEDSSPQLIVAHQGLGNDGQLWATSFKGVSQTGDQQVPNVGMSGSPALAVFDDILYFSHQGSGNDGQLWYTYTDGSHGWPGDQQVPNVGMSESPAVAAFNNNLFANPDLLYVFHQGSGNDGQLWYTSYTNRIGWAGDQQVPNVGMSGSPAVAVFNRLLYVFHQGSGNDGQLWYTSYNGSSWAGDQQVPNVGMSGSPAVAVFHNLLYVFHQGSGNDGQLWYTSYNGSSWTGDQQVPNTGMSGSPALAVYGVNLAHNDTLYVFHQGSGNDGQLWCNSYTGISWTGDRQVPNVGMSGSPALAVFPPASSGPEGNDGPGEGEAGGGDHPGEGLGDDDGDDHDGAPD